jgi:hypothetical protein
MRISIASCRSIAMRGRRRLRRGIEAALSAILVSREFLFRVERDPQMSRPYRVSDQRSGTRSRLSFFLWSSIPDEELLAVAERGELRKPDVLEKQTRRMLADPARARW